MTDREIMQQSLDALEKIAAYRPLTFAECSDAEAVMGIAEEAIPALRERLAQPEQEPVAWGCNRYIEDDNGFQIGTDEPELAWGKLAPDDNGWWPLYTTPPQRKPLPLRERARIVRANKMCHDSDEIDPYGVIDDVEAAHGIKENT